MHITIMNPLRILLLSALILVVFGVKEVDAEGLEWSYNTEGTIFSVAISADDEYITAGTVTGHVYLFHKDSNESLWIYDTGTSDIVRSVDISDDGLYIVAAVYDGTAHVEDDHKICLFHRDSSTPLWNYTTHSNVMSVAISADGEYIVAGGYRGIQIENGGEVYFFNRDNSIPLWNYTTNQMVSLVSISEDGEYISVAGAYDATVYLFHKDGDEPLWSYTSEVGDCEYPDCYMGQSKISADGEYIVAGLVYIDDIHNRYNSKIYFFNKDSNEPLWTYTIGNNNEVAVVDSVAISADGQYSVAGCTRLDTVHLFDKDTGHLWSYTTSNGVYTVDITPNGQYITAGNNDGNIYYFSKDNSTPLRNYTTTDDSTYSISITSDGRHVVAGLSHDNSSIFLFDMNPSSNVKPVATIDSIYPSSARLGDKVTFSGSGSDSDGTIIGYEWRSNIDQFLSDDEDFNIAVLSPGNHTIIFRVQDNNGEWSYGDTAELEIYPNTEGGGAGNEIPSPSILISSMILLLIAIFRRK